MQAAADEGIPVIAYDRLIEESRAIYLTFDNVEVGRMQARAVLEAQPNGNNVDEVVASNDGTAGGVVAALTAQGMEGFPVSGQDRDHAALNRVSIDLHPGEVVGLLGHNGAGKTTLIKMLSGAYTADGDEIWIDGKKATINNPRDARAYSIETIYQKLA